MVEDAGHGIDPGILDEVFSPFVRAGDARDSTGLGLAVVHAVVTAHGGQVDVRSDTTGTVVTLALPCSEFVEDPQAHAAQETERLTVPELEGALGDTQPRPDAQLRSSWRTHGHGR